jgi:hypothetical protein
MPERFTTYLTSKWAYLLYGFLAASLLILGIRFATYQPEHDTHIHANFGIFINGERETFKAPRYYEEVKLCSMHENMTPQARVHMHNQESGVIHVHHDGVTWGQLFENLGWYVGPDFIRTPDRLYTVDDVNKLNIVLNGDNLTGLSTITNELIDNRDRLLLSYGDADKAELDAQYKTVPGNAEEYNNKPDPAGCGGNHEVTIADRFKNLF